MNRTNTAKALGGIDVYLSLGFLFLVAFVFFCLPGNYILYFQETQSLFLFSGEYLHPYLVRPGGLLEYAAKFLTQFYADRLPGSLILSLILILLPVMLQRINRRLIPGNSYLLLPLLIPFFLMFLMQANYYHMMEYNLGFLLVILSYLFFTSIPAKHRHTIIIILFPLYYYLAGAYAFIFIVLYIMHNLFLEKGKRKYLNIAALVIIAFATFLISWKLLFLQPVQQFLLFPLPVFEDAGYTVTFSILAACLVFYPVIYRYITQVKNISLNTRLRSYLSGIIIFLVSGFLLFKIYNPQTAGVVEIERYVFGGKYDKAITYHEKHPSLNLIGQYFYNYALSETDQLCDRMFSGRQDFGAGSLILPWGDAHLNRGSYYYYSIGLINEAHRWAYEEMIVYGYRPQNLQMLAKTSLINGDYRMAGKYLGILKKTIFYGGWAKEYEKLIGNPGLILSHPELGLKLKILPKNNFFIQFNEPQNNLPLMLESQPDNRKAFEYYLAGLLLTKNVELAVNEIRKMKEIGYTSIPRHIEEAALIYYNATRILPDLGGLTISPETQSRFNQYFTLYLGARLNPSKLQETMQKNFGNTFWYFFHFK